MRGIRYGLLAGFIAGLLLTGLLFMDQGPGDQFGPIAQSLGLRDTYGSRWLAALLMFALAIVIGALFGALQRSASRWRALLWGAAFGVLWWAILFVLLGDMAQRIAFPAYVLLLYLMLSLVYGLVLASVYTAFV